MSPIGKALWFIESHFGEEMSLERIAAVSGVSRYHLSRTFGAATDYTVMGYVRRRRLSEAAKSLADGAGDVLGVALEAGYGSHEAFTSAFGELFGVTPETVRAQRHVDTLALVEPIKMDETPLARLEPPRFENGRPLLIAGLNARYNSETVAGIPAQWQRFGPEIGQIPGQVGRTTYGVCYNADDRGNMDYLSGVEVSDFALLPPATSRLRIAAQRYAVFAHRDHVANIRRTWHSIWGNWLPNSGYRIAAGPNYERYGESFDPARGTGEIEIWISLKT